MLFERENDQKHRKLLKCHISVPLAVTGASVTFRVSGCSHPIDEDCFLREKSTREGRHSKSVVRLARSASARSGEATSPTQEESAERRRLSRLARRYFANVKSQGPPPLLGGAGWLPCGIALSARVCACACLCARLSELKVADGGGMRWEAMRVWKGRRRSARACVQWPREFGMNGRHVKRSARDDEGGGEALEWEGGRDVGR